MKRRGQDFKDPLAAHALVHAIATGQPVHLVCADREQAKRVYDAAAQRIRDLQVPEVDEP